LLPALLITGAGMGMTFAPMTAAAMSQVPPRISGSASGILNTSRNIGQLLGIAVLGSVLQSRLGSHASEELLAIPGGDSVLLAEVANLIRDGRMEVIPSIVPQDMRDQLPAISETIKTVFVQALHETFYLAAFICLIALGFSFMMQNPRRRPAPEPGQAKEMAARPAVAD
jgi:MFS family permease